MMKATHALVFVSATARVTDATDNLAKPDVKSSHHSDIGKSFVEVGEAISVYGISSMHASNRKREETERGVIM